MHAGTKAPKREDQDGQEAPGVQQEREGRVLHLVRAAGAWEGETRFPILD